MAMEQSRKIRVECISVDSHFLRSYLTLSLSAREVALSFGRRSTASLPLLNGELSNTFRAIRRKFESKGYILKVCGSCSRFRSSGASSFFDETGFCSLSGHLRGVHLLNACDQFEYAAAVKRNRHRHRAAVPLSERALPPLAGHR